MKDYRDQDDVNAILEFIRTTSDLDKAQRLLRKAMDVAYNQGRVDGIASMWAPALGDLAPKPNEAR